MATVQAILEARQADPAGIARAIARLWKTQAVIGPGGACTRAAHKFLRTKDWTSCGAPVGQAGNGTAMRTAVLGLYFLTDPQSLPSAVADVCRITHQDPRSVAGGVAVAKAAQLLSTDTAACPTTLCDAVANVAAALDSTFGQLIRELPDRLKEDDSTAIHNIAWSGMTTPEFSEPIITPFVVPTVLAAFWCLLRHPDSWEKAVASAIRLGGDVDTLGAIVGSLLGAKLGVRSIPEHLLKAVVDKEELQTLALRYHALVTRNG